MKTIAIIAITCLACLGCSSNKTITETPTSVEAFPIADASSRTTSAMPKAIIYRMSGDYAANVPINVNTDGEITSFPDPSDLSQASMPRPLADGYWLDSRGVSTRSVFTTYTYARYMALSTPPNISTLKASIIPGARVTEVFELPMRLREAIKDTAAVNDLIRQGLPGCTRK